MLDFVTSYIRGHNGASPSLANIAAACGLTSRQHARDIVTALVVSGRLRRLHGQARGLQLPTDVDEAVRQARAAGYIVIDATSADPLVGAFPLTFSTLPRMPDLDQIAEGDGEGGDYGDQAERDGPTGPGSDRGALPEGGAGGTAGGTGAPSGNALPGAFDGGVEHPDDERRSAA